MRSQLGTQLESDGDAQSVFHQILLPHLVLHGASSAEEIEGRGLPLFRLNLEGGEILDVLELARRKRLIEPLPDCRDAYGDVIAQTEWAPTQRGRELKPPRGLTLAAFRDYVMAVTPAGPKIAQYVQYALVALGLVLGSAIGVSSSSGKDGEPVKAEPAPLQAGIMVGGIVVALCIGFVIYRGMAGDAKLRHAARVWKRLRHRWPKFWRWQSSWQRPWLGLLAVVLVTAPFGVRFLLGLHLHLWLLIPYFLGILLWLALFAVSRHCDQERSEDPGPVAIAPQPAE